MVDGGLYPHVGDWQVLIPQVRTGSCEDTESGMLEIPPHWGRAWSSRSDGKSRSLWAVCIVVRFPTIPLGVRWQRSPPSEVSPKQQAGGPKYQAPSSALQRPDSTASPSKPLSDF